MIVGICWYLAGLLMLTALCGLSTTVARGDETSATWLIAGCASGSLAFATTAVFLHSRKLHWIRESNLAKSFFFGVAVLVTGFLILLIVG
jgi:hypothetical protein